MAGVDMLTPRMKAINDREGDRVPSDLPPVIDAHVHIFPNPLFLSIRRWFDENAWPIRYRLRTSEIFSFLLSRGLTRIIAFQYAHKPGISGKLNAYMVEKCREFNPRVTGSATVFPGENQGEDILKQGFESGLKSLKLHAHVQCFDMNAEYMNPLYECCRVHQKPVVMHVGREPYSAAYRCDPYQLCSADKLERVLIDFPDLRICVPHLGLDELSAYRNLIERYDNLWLDTTMAIADYPAFDDKVDLTGYRMDRVMYGTDFPNIPYAWDRELKIIEKQNFPADRLEWLLHKSAAEFFDLQIP